MISIVDMYKFEEKDMMKKKDPLQNAFGTIG